MTCKILSFLLIVTLVFISGISSLENLKKNKIITKILKNKENTKQTNTLLQDTPVKEFSLFSSQGLYRLINRLDGPLILACALGFGPAVWKTTNSNGLTLLLKSDGNLVLKDNNEKEWWASNSGGRGVAPYKLVLEESGDLVIYDNNLKIVWNTGTAGKCSRQICFTVSEISESQSTNQFGLKYVKSNEGVFKCDVYGAKAGQRVCCDAWWKEYYSSSDVHPSPLSFPPVEYLTITNYGTDGLRITSIEVPGSTGDKFYPLKSRSGMYDGKLSGGCFSRFWIDRSGNGSCASVVIVFNNNYYSSKNGNCLKISCV